MNFIYTPLQFIQAFLIGILILTFILLLQPLRWLSLLTYGRKPLLPLGGALVKLGEGIDKANADFIAAVKKDK